MLLLIKNIQNKIQYIINKICSELYIMIIKLILSYMQSIKQSIINYQIISVPILCSQLLLRS